MRTRAVDESNVLIVQDGGTGIATEWLESIFEPFVTSKREGLGMGLSICRSIIERHGGKISAANNPGRGAKWHRDGLCEGLEHSVRVHYCGMVRVRESGTSHFVGTSLFNSSRQFCTTMMLLGAAV